MRAPSTKPSEQQGFALVVIVLVVALVAVVGASMLDVLQIDLAIVGNQAARASATEYADGLLMEVLNEPTLGNNLPVPAKDAAQLSSNYVLPTTSKFTSNYTATVRLLRVAPRVGTSQLYGQNAVYEISVSATGDRFSASESAAEVYKLLVRSPGTITQNVHDR